MSTPLLQVKNLSTSFNVDSGEVRAVNGISFNLLGDGLRDAFDPKLRK